MDEDFDPKECDIIVSLTAMIKVRVKGYKDSEFIDIQEDVEKILYDMCDVEGVENILIESKEMEKEMD